MGVLFHASSGEIVSWLENSGELSDKKTKTHVSALSPGQITVSPKGNWVAIYDASNPTVQIYPNYGEGVLGDGVATTFPVPGASEGCRGIAFSKHDESLLAVVQQRDLYIMRVAIDGSVSILDSVSVSFSGPPGGCDWNEAGDRVACSDGLSDGVVLCGWNGATLTRLAVGNNGEDRRPFFFPDGKLFMGINNQNPGTVEMFDISADSFVLLDAAAHNASSWEWQKPNAEGTYAVAGSRQSTGTSKLFSIAGDGTLTEITTFGHDVWHIAWITETLFAVTVNELLTDRIIVYEASPVGLTEVYFEAFANSQTGDMAYFKAAGPTTDEEVFQATYANASAAPPKITALIQPADVQRSIDTDVNNLALGAKFYSVEAIIDIGEISTYQPGLHYSVKADQPGLRDGKILLLKQPPIFRSADPAVPATLVFWG